MRNRGTQTDVRFVGPALRTLQPHRSLCNPRRAGEGAYDTVSAPGHILLPTIPPTRQASGGQRALPLCTPHQSAPGFRALRMNTSQQAPS